MALTADVKEELAKLEVSKTTVRAAELATILRFSGGLHMISNRIAVESELDSATVARRVRDRKSTRLNSSHMHESRMPSSA